MEGNGQWCNQNEAHPRGGLQKRDIVCHPQRVTASSAFGDNDSFISSVEVWEDYSWNLKKSFLYLE